MIDIEKLGLGTLAAIRARGWEDEQIKSMTTDEAFDEYCAWHIGTTRWGSMLRRAVEEIKAAEIEEEL